MILNEFFILKDLDPGGPTRGPHAALEAFWPKS